MSYIVAMKSLGRWKRIDRILYPLGREAYQKAAELNATQTGEFKAFDADHEPGSTIAREGSVPITETITDIRSVVAGLIREPLIDRLKRMVETFEPYDEENDVDDVEMRERLLFAREQPKPFPFTDNEQAAIHTENFRRFLPQDFSAAHYMWATGMEDPADLFELAVMMDKARRWYRSQEKRQAMGDETPIKPWVLEWQDSFDFLVTMYDRIGLDWFTGEETAAPRLDPKNLN